VDVAGIVSDLTRAGYQGWYVLEQEVILGPDDADPKEDVRESLAYLRRLMTGQTGRGERADQAGPSEGRA
jgi:inosose dehydratase